MGRLRPPGKRAERPRGRRRARRRRAGLRHGVLLRTSRQARRPARRRRSDSRPARHRATVHGRDRHRVPARGSGRRGRAVARCQLRPGGVGVRRERLGRPVSLDTGGGTAAPPGRTPRLLARHAPRPPLLPGRRRRDHAAPAAVLRPAQRPVDAGGGHRVPADLRRLDPASCETPASGSSAWSSCRHRRTRRGTSTTRTTIQNGAGAGPRRRFGSPASAPDPRVDEPAAQSDPRAARDPVRGRPARLRRGRPAGRGPDRARDEARGGQGALRARRTAGSRSVSTPPSCSTAGSTASPGMPTTRPGCCGSSRDARTRSSPACACSAPARTWSPTS